MRETREASRQRDNRLNAFEQQPIVVLVCCIGIETYFSRHKHMHTYLCELCCICYNNANDADDYDNICTRSAHIFTTIEADRQIGGERETDPGS